MAKRIVFVSSNFTWGGSEILWSQAAAELARRGHRVRAYKNRFDAGEGNTEGLKDAGVACVELARFPLLPRRLYSLLLSLTPHLSHAFQAFKLHLSLSLRAKPDLIVLSQGGNHDGWLLGAVCRRAGVRFVIICQKATDLYWPSDRFRRRIVEMYRAADHVFFVSRHNQALTAEQLGEPIGSSSVVRNPFLVPWQGRDDWPDGEGARFACVGRLYPLEKGQDILLRVLARPKWMGRPLSVSFYGSGEQRIALEAMAAYLGLRSVRFAGHESDVASIWADHHGLILPSRAEGLPLVLVEAMLCARVAIVTDVAGNAEVVDDDETGFLAVAPTEDALDEAMDRAWARRDEWRAIGARAAASVRRLVPENPAADLADRLLALAEAPSQGPA
ncbi:MAG TPA: glycosyltransferase family 4 protein [Allosphingosinicella sp.]|nr:glycosyltransferase family 4 protein [Allosphingosinicella sp.]